MLVTKKRIIINAEIKKRDNFLTNGELLFQVKIILFIKGNAILRLCLSVFLVFIHPYFLNFIIFKFQQLVLQFSPRKLVKTSLLASTQMLSSCHCLHTREHFDFFHLNCFYFVLNLYTSPLPLDPVISRPSIK